MLFQFVCRLPSASAALPSALSSTSSRRRKKVSGRKATSRAASGGHAAPLCGSGELGLRALFSPPTQHERAARRLQRQHISAGLIRTLTYSRRPNRSRLGAGEKDTQTDSREESKKKQLAVSAQPHCRALFLEQLLFCVWDDQAAAAASKHQAEVSPGRKHNVLNLQQTGEDNQPHTQHPCPNQNLSSSEPRLGGNLG